MTEEQPQTRIQYRRLNTLPGVEYVLEERRGPLAPAAVSPGFSIATVDQGEAEVVFDGVHHRLTPDVVVLRPPGAATTVERRLSPMTAYRGVIISEETLLRVGREVSPDGKCTLPRFTATVSNDARLLRAVRAFLQVFEQTSTAAEQEARLGELVRALAQVHMLECGEAVPPWSAREEVLLARSYIDSHFAGEVTLDQLQEVAGLSKFHLLRVFRREVGMTPHAYQVRVRVAHARRMLQHGRASAEVAEQTGFADQSHFIRHFKRVVGITPARYARIAR